MDIHIPTLYVASFLFILGMLKPKRPLPLMKTLPDKLQPVNDPRPPISPRMRSVAYPELMRHTLIHQRYMQQTVALAQVVVIAAISSYVGVRKVLRIEPFDIFRG